MFGKNAKESFGTRQCKNRGAGNLWHTKRIQSGTCKICL